MGQCTQELRVFCETRAHERLLPRRNNHSFIACPLARQVTITEPTLRAARTPSAIATYLQTCDWRVETSFCTYYSFPTQLTIIRLTS